jgi:hypothetical protein
MKFKVLDPKGIHANGKRYEPGDTVKLPDGAALKVFLHFKQVEPVEEEAKAPKEPKEPKAPKEPEEPKAPKEPEEPKK